MTEIDSDGEIKVQMVPETALPVYIRVNRVNEFHYALWMEGELYTSVIGVGAEETTKDLANRIKQPHIRFTSEDLPSDIKFRDEQRDNYCAGFYNNGDISRSLSPKELDKFETVYKAQFEKEQ
jgi:hypothetical protein